MMTGLAPMRPAPARPSSGLRPPRAPRGGTSGGGGGGGGGKRSRRAREEEDGMEEDNDPETYANKVGTNRARRERVYS
eukprot:1092037-Prorocentrum_minimum.AAC.1